MNVKELKDKLTELVNSLNDFDENTEAVIEIDGITFVFTKVSIKKNK